MKTLLFALVLIPSLAHAGETYRCTFGGFPVGELSLTIELLADGSANLTQFPPLVRHLNPARVESAYSELKIISQVEAGPFPGNPEIQRAESVVYLNTTARTLRFPAQHGHEEFIVGCAKAE